MKRPIQKTETEEQRRYREVVESIAKNISLLARAATSLLNGRLKRRALVILLAHSSQCSQRQVDEVLKALETLEKDWLQ